MNYREGTAQCSIPKFAFKAVENFFRRISFNLGNTPSETDIKIVSCIPVDVSDLQAKILCLEKELETHKKRGVKFKNSAVHTTLISQNLYTDSMATQTRPDEVNLDKYVYLRREATPKQAHTTSTVSHNQDNINRVPSLGYDIMGIKDTDYRPRRHIGGHNKVRIQRDHQAYRSQVHTPLLQGNDWNSLVENGINRKSDKNIKSHSLDIDTLSNLSRNNLTFNRDSLCDSDICLRPTKHQANFETHKHAFDDSTVILTPKHSERGNATTSKFYNDRYYDLVPVKIHGNSKSKSKEKSSSIANLMEELAMNKTNYMYTDYAIDRDEECPSTHNQSGNHALHDIFKKKTNTDETSKHSKDCSTSKPKSNKQAQNFILTEETSSKYLNLSNDMNQMKTEMKTKTDETLSEIKTILKGVVHLVKRRSSRTMLARKRGCHLAKKDAVVYKDLNDLPIERLRLYHPPSLEPECNYSYYPYRPMEPIVQSCFVPSQQNPYYPFNPVGHHYYQSDPRQLHCYPYRY